MHVSDADPAIEAGEHGLRRGSRRLRSAFASEASHPTQGLDVSRRDAPQIGLLHACGASPTRRPSEENDRTAVRSDARGQQFEGPPSRYRVSIHERSGTPAQRSAIIPGVRQEEQYRTHLPVA
jgi:hypothetical protein